MAVGEEVQIPDRAATILEAESLFDDATGLVLYRLAVAAVVSGRVSAVSLGEQLIVMVVGGVLVGLVVGWLGAWMRRHAADTRVETVASLLIPFAAWVPAEQFGLSGAVAVVTAGIYVGREMLPYIPIRGAFSNNRVLGGLSWVSKRVQPFRRRAPILFAALSASPYAHRSVRASSRRGPRVPLS